MLWKGHIFYIPWELHVNTSSIETCNITQLENKFKPLRSTTKDSLQLKIRNYKDKTLIFEINKRSGNQFVRVCVCTSYRGPVALEIGRHIPELLDQTKLLINILHLFWSKIHDFFCSFWGPKPPVQILCTSSCIESHLFELLVRSREAPFHLLFNVLHFEELDCPIPRRL